MMVVTESEFHNRGLPRVTDLSLNFTVLDGGGTYSTDRVLDLKIMTHEKKFPQNLAPEVKKFCAQLLQHVR